MPAAVTNLFQDVLEVCRNGHIVTDRRYTCPEESRYHCESCGATTLHACPTCGQDIAGALVVPGLQPVGTIQPPLYCSACGAAFPWRRRPLKTEDAPTGKLLESFLRRLPETIRQLRQRWGTRPPFCVNDEHDLEDLVRSLLPLYFDDVRLRSRTPSYAADTRTDFLIHPERIMCTLKHTSPAVRQPQLEQQVQEDKAFYRGSQECRSLWIYVFDPQGHLYNPKQLEAMWRGDEGLEVCVLIGS